MVQKNEMVIRNKIIRHKKSCLIELYDRKGNIIAYTLFDYKWLRPVSFYKWRLNHNGYVITHDLMDRNKNIFLHHLILGRKKGYDIDHKNRMRLDNRLINLRFVTRSQNLMNRKKKPVGITWNKNNKRWQAQIGFRNKQIFLGYFKNKKDAIKKRQESERKYFKEYMRV